jgi:purine nucleosidase
VIDVVIDTDIGADPDDAIAVALAVASSELSVRGLTIVSGDVDWRARIATRVLGMLGRPDIPVIRGGLPGGMLGIEGRGVLDLEAHDPEATVQGSDAAGWLIEQSLQRPFHLVAIGPLTNLAEAIERDPAFATRLHGITVMGGMLDPDALPESVRDDLAARGVSEAWPDYNTMCDPQAALTVATSGATVQWTTTDVTFTVPLSRAALGLLPADDAFTGALREMIGSWDAYRAESGTSIHGEAVPAGYTDTFLHDPLTVASLWPGDWLTMTPVALDFAIEDGVFRMHRLTGEERPNAVVSTQVDGDAFATLCMRRIADHLVGLRPKAG